MSLGQHLVELRKRLFRAVLAIAVCAVAGWFLTPWVLDALRAPVRNLARAGGGHVAELNFPVITGAFDLRLQIAITIGIVISSPVWLYQVWAFIVPALVRREKLYVIGFFGSAIPLFLGGCFCGWYVLPHIVGILGSFVSHEDASIVDAKTYYDFVIKLVLAIGIAFVLPVFLVLLNFVGVLSAAAIIGSWRIAILCILVFTALVTPSADVISMFLLAVPMVVLYIAACAVSWFHDRRAARRQAAVDAEYGL
ncbi:MULTISPECIES: twin-arginine translocase subunit TatC [unclassified Curtobacterium]|uniref:twin-arginine translocase subunit TatC n=1 Tax=unclassified Curtobacterium TaxID=257496 RepID=UPI000DA9F176|nr:MULTISPECIES: twin-arginine translocase subunit TatC [unclassified Curtobacterium]PZE29011.1 twin-arginine translocase subunit TatC [Curtobacterium sp. MCBD17_028]PZE77279.1 twin-arginine translocase subunit TatC [Curtobacterium sp. MCBD17_019]PZF59353.1 twin-arginine translocase subunit TatC [Curtobacterium sp. MCBD17_034]PZF65393.1 twin-arginine translocase subunit TatC [Curtobacterium sp. MCBD17_013]PZM34379.1 twin-arginine translocase subunit TatC [Curtobacterium sp. MCBD17_031]